MADAIAQNIDYTSGVNTQALLVLNPKTMNLYVNLDIQLDIKKSLGTGSALYTIDISTLLPDYMIEVGSGGTKFVMWIQNNVSPTIFTRLVLKTVQYTDTIVKIVTNSNLLNKQFLSGSIFIYLGKLVKS